MDTRVAAKLPSAETPPSSFSFAGIKFYPSFAHKQVEMISLWKGENGEEVYHARGLSSIGAAAMEKAVLEKKRKLTNQPYPFEVLPEHIAQTWQDYSKDEKKFRALPDDVQKEIALNWNKRERPNAAVVRGQMTYRASDYSNYFKKKAAKLHYESGGEL